ncbi:isoaspartyl peptidase/L-asparaginase [candidate division KSB1 bacterium]|nr:isoaspartyl peptidase/L-asparaginase [candidate division KSB1 bacterium]
MIHTPALIVHGGAWDILDEAVEDHKRGCSNAVAAGWRVLAAGGSALDAVTAAVVVMEDDPTFDAGRGSFLNADAEVELDASIMRGSDLKAGAVAAVRRLRHPIQLARLVMEGSEHVLLVGRGAEKFASSRGIKFCRTRDLLVGRELQRYQALRSRKDFHVREVFEKQPRGTVGAVAFDNSGSLAAATSTGGTPQKMPGRVGDSPIIGAGTFADNESGAALSTGWGESILRVLLAKTACDFLKEHNDANRAAKEAIQVLEKRVAGKGGVILIDRFGGVGLAFNTPRMAYALRQGEKIFKIGI